MTSRGRLPLTEEDILWLMRAVVGEGGEPATVIWALASRWAFLRLWRRTINGRPAAEVYPTFTSFIRAYSQPVSPRWLADGDKCRGRRSGACSPARVRRREALQSMPMENIPYDKALPVVRFFQGRLPNEYPSVTDFHAARSLAEARAMARRRRDLVYVGLVRGNALFANPATVDWSDGVVRVAASATAEPVEDDDTQDDPAPVPAPAPTTPPSDERRTGPGAVFLWLLLAMLGVASTQKKRR